MERDTNYPESSRLQELGGSDFEIADNQPNIKGWLVKNEQGQTIGEVEELIFDVQSRKVRYMVVDLERSVLDLEARDVLVPIGLAELHEKDDEVILPGIMAEQLRALPAYEKKHIGRDTEHSVRSAFANLGGSAGAALAAIGGATNRAGETLDHHAHDHSDAATPGTHTTNPDDFYNHSHFDENNLNRNRTPRTNPNNLRPGAYLPGTDQNPSGNL